jgi:glycosyltransferase involved in cell wall biosynthesis
MRATSRTDCKCEVLAAIPAYNEEEAIDGLIEALKVYGSLTDVLVVDDSSTDECGDCS